MSINSKMTAIADAIRLKTGRTDTLTIDEMTTAVNGLEVNPTPEISVNSTNGLITVTAGAKTSTHQLAFQPAKTITPSAVSQIAVSSGYYTGGDVVVAAIPSQYIIPSGTLTISTNGTHDVKNYASAVVSVESGSGSGEAAEWSENEDRIIMGTVHGNYSNDRVTAITNMAFYGCLNLSSVDFPAVTEISSSAFMGCYKLYSVNFPALTTIADRAFCNCSSLRSVDFPAVTKTGESAFMGCTELYSVNLPALTIIQDYEFYNCFGLNSVDFPAASFINNLAFYGCLNLSSANFSAVTEIGESAFYMCTRLSSVTLGTSTFCILRNSNAFASTPFENIAASAAIYVPASLIKRYKAATNWTYFSNYFRTIENGDAGEDSSTIITFTIGNNEYQADNGMTWGEWCDSSYNTIGAYASEWDVCVGEGVDTQYIYDEDWESVTAINIIMSDYSYILSY